MDDPQRAAQDPLLKRRRALDPFARGRARPLKRGDALRGDPTRGDLGRNAHHRPWWTDVHGFKRAARDRGSSAPFAPKRPASPAGRIKKGAIRIPPHGHRARAAVRALAVVAQAPGSLPQEPWSLRAAGRSGSARCAALRSARHRQDAACAGGRRRGGRRLLLDVRLGVRRGDRRRRASRVKRSALWRSPRAPVRALLPSGLAVATPTACAAPSAPAMRAHLPRLPFPPR